MSPLPSKMFGAHGVENGARIDARRDPEADARGEIRLDQAGDDVHARAAAWPRTRCMPTARAI